MAFWKPLPDGRGVFVYAMVLDQGEVSIGGMETEARKDAVWMYDTVEHAIAAAKAWDGTGDPPADGCTRGKR
jgi:hypothetical protein